MIVGLTGGIGSGKSTVAKILTVLGYPVYNSDKQAHVLCNQNRDLINKIKALFGEEIYQNGELNRKALGAFVFKDKEKLNALNGLIHPAVALDFKEWLAKQRSNLVFKEAAILFESGAYKQVDESILVSAPKNIRLERVKKRDGLSEEQILARMANQWTETERKALTNYIIYADDKHFLVPQVLSILEKINN